MIFLFYTIIPIISSLAAATASTSAHDASLDVAAVRAHDLAAESAAAAAAAGENLALWAMDIQSAEATLRPYGIFATKAERIGAIRQLHADPDCWSSFRLLDSRKLTILRKGVSAETELFCEIMRQRPSYPGLARRYPSPDSAVRTVYPVIFRMEVFDCVHDPLGCFPLYRLVYESISGAAVFLQQLHSQLNGESATELIVDMLRSMFSVKLAPRLLADAELLALEHPNFHDFKVAIQPAIASRRPEMFWNLFLTPLWKHEQKPFPEGTPQRALTDCIGSKSAASCITKWSEVDDYQVAHWAAISHFARDTLPCISAAQDPKNAKSIEECARLGPRLQSRLTTHGRTLEQALFIKYLIADPSAGPEEVAALLAPLQRTGEDTFKLHIDYQRRLEEVELAELYGKLQFKCKISLDHPVVCAIRTLIRGPYD